MKKEMLAVALLSVIALTSCRNPFDAWQGKGDDIYGGGGSSVEILPPDKDADPKAPQAIDLKITQKTSDFLFGTEIDLANSFEVTAVFDKETKKVAPYDATQKAGWFLYSILDSKGNPVEEIVSPSTALEKYSATIAFKESGKGIRNKTEFPINIRGGSMTDEVPDLFEATFNIKEYNVGDTFNINDFTVTGTWNTYGGKEELKSGDGTNGFKFESATIDLAEPFAETGDQIIKFSYRGINKDVKIHIATGGRKKIDFDNNTFHDHTYITKEIMPTTGNTKSLVVPVWFTDSSDLLLDNPSMEEAEKTRIRNDLETIYNGTAEQTGWHSVKSYYLEDSYGKLNIDSIVSEWYEAPYQAATFTQNNTVALVKEVGAWYAKTHGTKAMQDLDSNKDGFIDSITLIYAFPDQQAFPDPLNPNLWAYCFWVQDNSLRNVNNPGVNQFFWASYDFMYKHINEGKFDKYPVKLDGHTYIHEMGHILGLVDYYDYNNITKPAGGFSMQDANVGGHDPFSKLLYNWVEPYVPVKTEVVTLRPFVENPDLILLSPDFTGSAFDEYILIEYFAPTGLNYLDTHFAYASSYPKGTLKSGLRVWHVDGRLYDLINKPDKGLSSKETVPLYTRNDGIVDHLEFAMTNTTYIEGKKEGYVSPFKGFHKYDQLALLNKTYGGRSVKYEFKQDFSNDHLWKVNDEFSMEKYKSSFPNDTKLNSGLELGFSFKVLSMDEKECKIQITKL